MYIVSRRESFRFCVCALTPLFLVGFAYLSFRVTSRVRPPTAAEWCHNSLSLQNIHYQPPSSETNKDIMLTTAARHSLRLSSKYAAPRVLASRSFTIGDSFKSKLRPIAVNPNRVFDEFWVLVVNAAKVPMPFLRFVSPPPWFYWFEHTGKSGGRSLHARAGKEIYRV